MSDDFYSGIDEQGAQMIPSAFAYTHDIRYSHSSGKLWFIADKSVPNVYDMYSQGSAAKDFHAPKVSPLNKDLSLPYLSFDVLNVTGKDYIVGINYGTTKSGNKFGLSLQVSSSTDDKKVVSKQIKDCNFYSILVDPTTPTASSTFDAYLVGFCFNPKENAGMVLSKATVQISGEIVINWSLSDVQLLHANENCYDIWTETTKPQLYLSKIDNQNEYLYISIPGRCNGIYKYKVYPGQSPFSPTFEAYFDPNLHPEMTDIKIVQAAFSHDKIFFVGKKYNKDESLLYFLDTKTMTKSVLELLLPANESTPIITLDPTGGIVYIATSGFDKIFKISTTDLSVKGIAVLPMLLSPASSLYSINQFLYIVTYEPNAVLGRISDKNFCKDFCSFHGYCNAGTCACIKDYARDFISQNFICRPSHYVQNQNIILGEQGAAAAFGVLFAFAIVAAIAGWFLWFRGRNSYMKQ